MPATGPLSRRHPRRLGRLRGVLALGLVAGLVALAPAAQSAPSRSRNAYHQTNLVSDLPGLAQLTDPDLVNPWGLAAGPTTPVWVADNGTDKATIYPASSTAVPSRRPHWWSASRAAPPLGRCSTGHLGSRSTTATPAGR